MDVVARSLISALYDTGKPRENTLFIAVLHGPPTPPLSLYIRPSGSLRQKPSEKEAGLLLLELLKRVEDRVVEARREETVDVVKNLKKQGFTVHLLLEKGADVSAARFSTRNAFVIGDQIGFPPKVQKELESVCDEVISIGKLSYLASHCILYLHELLDRLEFSLTSRH